jgi:dTMP kinase
VPLQFRPGSVLVLEGLDGTGKSTQLDRMKQWEWTEPAPTFAHMPSGLVSLTTAIYELTEHEVISSPLARQLLHMACHAENMESLVAGRDGGGLVLDRWWWSTMAYGWFGADLASRNVPEAVFREMIQTVWNPIDADLVLVFMTPHTSDPLNLAPVRYGYNQLIDDAGPKAVEVPRADPDVTMSFIQQVLDERGLLTGDG